MAELTQDGVPAQAEAGSRKPEAQTPRHPLAQRRILVPLVLLLAVVHLPFIHWALRGQPAVTAAVPFRDDFNRATLGNDYWSNGGLWRIVPDKAAEANGVVYSPGVGNNPLWLKARLPADVRIDFDVRSEAATGDVKWEAFGDGRNHSTGYVFVFGGWDNGARSGGLGFDRIAKLEEHGFTEQEIRAQKAQLARPWPSHETGLAGLVESVTSVWTRWRARVDLEELDKGTYFGRETPVVVKRSDLKVEKGRTYHVTLTKKGNFVRWENDGQLVLELRDPAPLSGPGHDRFGFSSWANDTYFDNLKIEGL